MTHFQTFKKRPDQLRAVRVDHHNMIEVSEIMHAVSVSAVDLQQRPIVLFELQGGETLQVRAGDYIVRGFDDEQKIKYSVMAHDELWEAYSDESGN